MKYLENEAVVNLLTWEVNPAKRNKNNQVTFICPTKIEVEKGDVLFARPTGATASCYEVTEILETRPAAITKNTHYTVLTKWNRREVLDIYNHPNKLISNSTQNLAIGLQEAAA